MARRIETGGMTSVPPARSHDFSDTGLHKLLEILKPRFSVNGSNMHSPRR